MTYNMLIFVVCNTLKIIAEVHVFNTKLVVVKIRFFLFSKNLTGPRLIPDDYELATCDCNHSCILCDIGGRAIFDSDLIKWGLIVRVHL